MGLKRLDSRYLWCASQVLVLDAGRVAEFDSVPSLLSRPGGQFRGMVADAGLLP